MKKIFVAICEDDKTQLDYMKSLVDNWAKCGDIPCHIEGYISAEQIWYSFDSEMPFQLYILDIQMGEMNGMELARKIREKDRKAGIIFLTGLREYALEGYEVGAARYLIKPIREEELFSVLTEVYEAKETSEKKDDGNVFLLEQGDGIQKIRYRDIWYLEAQGHYVRLVYGTEEVTWKTTFSSLQPVFEENGFVMVKRGLLVNIRSIAKIGRNSCVLDNGEEIPISRSQYKKVNEIFIHYYDTRGKRL